MGKGVACIPDQNIRSYRHTTNLKSINGGSVDVYVAVSPFVSQYLPGSFVVFGHGS